jgi:hypothetical protein
VAVFAAAASEVGSDLGRERDTRGREREERSSSARGRREGRQMREVLGVAAGGPKRKLTGVE